MTTAAEKQHMGRVAELGCCLCRRYGWHGTPAEVHHVRTGTGAGRRASHFDVIPLCPSHHRQGADGLHVMGRKAWERAHGVTELELLAGVRAELLGDSERLPVAECARDTTDVVERETAVRAQQGVAA